MQLIPGRKPPPLSGKASRARLPASTPARSGRSLGLFRGQARSSGFPPPSRSWATLAVSRSSTAYLRERLNRALFWSWIETSDLPIKVSRRVGLGGKKIQNKYDHTRPTRNRLHSTQHPPRLLAITTTRDEKAARIHGSSRL